MSSVHLLIDRLALASWVEGVLVAFLGLLYVASALPLRRRESPQPQARRRIAFLIGVLFVTLGVPMALDGWKGDLSRTMLRGEAIIWGHISLVVRVMAIVALIVVIIDSARLSVLTLLERKNHA